MFLLTENVYKKYLDCCGYTERSFHENQVTVMLEHFTFSSCFEQISKGLIMTSCQLIFKQWYD